jgi:hypothetical protein
MCKKECQQIENEPELVPKQEETPRERSAECSTIFQIVQI